MKNNKIVFYPILAALLLGITFSLWACSRQNQTSKEGIGIGATVPLTGDLAAWGNREKNGILLAIDEVNAQRKPANKFKLHMEDTKSSPSVGVTVIQKLIDINKVKFVIGDVSSGITLAMAPIAERNHVLMLSPGASSPALTTAGDYIFRNWPSDVYDGADLAYAAKVKMGAHKVVVFNEDNTYSEGLADAFVAEAKKINLSIVGRIRLSAKNTEYRSLLEKSRSFGGDLVFVAAHPSMSAQLFLQMKEMGMPQKRLGCVAIQGPEFTKIYPNASDIYFTTIPLDKKSNGVFRSFAKKYKKRFGKEPDVEAAHAYDAVKMFAFAIPTASTTADQAKAALYGMKNFKGATGTMSFDANGDVHKPLALMKYEHGKAHLVELLPADL